MNHPEPVSIAFSIWRVRPHRHPSHLSISCDGGLSIHQGTRVLFVEAPEFLLVELARDLGRWLLVGEGAFVWNTSDDEAAPTLAFAPDPDGRWSLGSCYVHWPGAFDEEGLRTAAHGFVRALERELRVLGYSMVGVRPEAVTEDAWGALLDGEGRPPGIGARTEPGS